MLLLGDRFEIFAVAAATAARHIPIAHISGGDVTLGRGGRILPPLHQQNGGGTLSVLRRQRCAACADGEAPDTVFCVGRAGGENIRTLPKMTVRELCKSTGFDLMQPFALVTYHPETAPDAGSPAVQVQALCDAMAAVDGVFWLITGSNADAAGRSAHHDADVRRRPPGTAPDLCRASVCGATSPPWTARRSWRATRRPVSSRRPPLKCRRSTSADGRPGRAICANVLCCDARRAGHRGRAAQGAVPGVCPRGGRRRQPV